MRAVWRNRRLRALFAGSLVSRLGSWMSTLVVTFLAFDETGSAFWAAVVATAYAVPSALASLPAGSVADRVSSRRLLFLAQAGQLVTITALGVGALTTDTLLPWLIVLGAVSGIFSAFAYVAWQEVIHDVATHDELITAVSTNSTLTNVAKFTGPPLGGLLFVQFGAAAVFFLDAGSFVPVLAVLAVVPVTRSRAGAARSPSSLREALGVARRHPGLRWILLLAAVAGVLAAPLGQLLAPLARDLGHQGAHRLGLLMACIAVGSVAEVGLVSLTGRRVRISDMVRVCYFAMCIVLLALGGAFVLVVVAVVLLVYGLVRTASRSVLMSAIHIAAPERHRDHLIGVFGFVDTMVTFVAALGWGLTADAIGMSRTTVFAGAVLLMLVTAFALRNKFANLDPPEMVATLPQHFHLIDWEPPAWRRGHALDDMQGGRTTTRQPA